MRYAAAFVLLPVGAGSAIATVALHGVWWGFLLGAAATGATVVALPGGWWSRLPFAVGWVALVGLLTVPRPEGDYAISGDPAGYSLLAGSLVLLVFAIATLPRPRATREDPPGAPRITG